MCNRVYYFIGYVYAPILAPFREVALFLFCGHIFKVHNNLI